MHYLPDLGCPALRILGQKRVQEGSATPGQAGNEKGANDALAIDLRVALSIGNHEQPVAKHSEYFRIDADAAEEIEIGIGLERPEQNVKGMEKVITSEIAEPRAPDAFFHQGTGFELYQFVAFFLKIMIYRIDTSKQPGHLDISRLEEGVAVELGRQDSWFGHWMLLGYLLLLISFNFTHSGGLVNWVR
jgi:hypothetical protein